MKYKVGDRVKVVDRLKGHLFNIGDNVTITEEYPEGNPPHYRADNERGGYWWLTDEEIELYEEKKMPKYTTEPIDYTGCHPVIAEHLKRGEAILCRVWGYGNKEEWKDQEPERVIAFKGGKYPYTTLDSAGSWLNAEPIPTKRKVLMSTEKAVVKLIENGWKLSPDCTEIQKPGTGLILEYLKEREGMERSMLELYPDYLFEEEEEVEVDD